MGQTEYSTLPFYKSDFTYVGNIMEGVFRIIKSTPKGNPQWNSMNPDPSSSKSPYKIYNIGNNSPVKLMDFITALEKELGITAKKNWE